MLLILFVKYNLIINIFKAIPIISEFNEIFNSWSDIKEAGMQGIGTVHCLLCKVIYRNYNNEFGK